MKAAYFFFAVMMSAMILDLSSTLVDGKSITQQPRNCLDVKSNGETKDGVYTVHIGEPGSERPVKVYCEVQDDDDGWIVMQRRTNGTLSFYRNWADYVTGFGHQEGDFWLGLEYIHLLTSSGGLFDLKIELTGFQFGEYAEAEYDNFAIGSSATNYKLISVGNYDGTAGDSLSYNVGSPFSTYDKNNARKKQCVPTSFGAWWYKDCTLANLNGRYYDQCETIYEDGVFWATYQGDHDSLKKTVMKIRPHE